MKHHRRIARWRLALFPFASAVLLLAGIASAQPENTGSSEELYAPVEVSEPASAGSQPEAPELPTTPDTEEGPPGGVLGVFGVDLKLRGRLEGNMHYRVEDKSIGPIYDRKLQPVGISRYETTFNLHLQAGLGSFTGVADIDVDLLGYGDDRLGQFDELTRRDQIFPVRLEVHAAYLEATDLLVEGLDLRLGQQLVKFGVGDQFNPSDTLNPADLENVLLFGKQQANLMLRVDYGFLETWSATAVCVPVFKPAVLPRSALAGITAVERLPFVHEATRLLLHVERDYMRDTFGNPTTVSDVQYQLPKLNLENMQWYARIGGELFGQDIALSYYYGRSDMPQVIQNHSELVVEPHCHDPLGSECYDGWLSTTVTLAYPRIQVVGINIAGELPLDIGYRIEAGIYVPGQRRAKITTGDLGWLAQEGEYDYITPDGYKPIVVEGVPFAKWVIGLDYTFGRYFYLNAMWVHGLADELGPGDFFHEGSMVRAGGTDPDANTEVDCMFADPRTGERCAWEIQRSRLGDYLVLGVDFKFNDGAGLVRLFAILDLTGYVRRFWDTAAEEPSYEHYHLFTEKGFSAVIYPEVNYNFGNGLELGGGVLLQLGQPHTKFGDPAAGGSLVFVRGRFTF